MSSSSPLHAFQPFVLLYLFLFVPYELFATSIFAKCRPFFIFRTLQAKHRGATPPCAILRPLELEKFTLPRCFLMRRGLLLSFLLCFLSLLLCTLTSSSRAQLPPAKTDPLAKHLSAPSGAACSETEASSCAAAVAKIVPLVMGASPFVDNVRAIT